MKMSNKTPVTLVGMIVMIVVALAAWSEVAPWYGKARRAVASKIRGDA